jgi:DNA invertase Pin-like site-specific DNA recombinase
MPALAFSYTRFSSLQQAGGRSVKRQEEARDAWLKAHPAVTLDTSLDMADLGRSAFKRKDFATYALGRFVVLVESGRVPAGSYLLVENLDRLSREHAGQAVELFLRLVNRGIVVVQLLPVVVEFKAPVDAMSLMLAVVELSRGHSESAMKSERGQDAWRAKRKQAAEGKTISRRAPCWITVGPAGEKVVNEDKAAVVRRLFRMAREGHGVTRICQILNDEGVPYIGRPLMAGRPTMWNSRSVFHILRSRSVLGELALCKDRKPTGQVVKGYWPAILAEKEFLAVQGIMDARRKCAAGRPGKRVNLLAGLLVDARTGGTLYYKVDGKYPPVLVPSDAQQGRGRCWASFPARVFEAMILRELAEVKAADIWPAGDGLDSEAIAGRLAKVDAALAHWKARMDDLDIAEEVADQLVRLSAERRELRAELQRIEGERAHPSGSSWGEFKGLAEAFADGDDALRLRIRDALRRCVRRVVCLFIGSSGLGPRVAAVQVEFRHSDARRHYVIVRRYKRDPEAGTLLTGDSPAPDLGKKADVARVEKLLSAIARTPGKD